MAALSDLTPYITNSLPMVSDLLATQQLNRAARTMCSESDCWKYEYTFNTVVGTADYTYTLPTDTERTRVEYVRHNDEYLKPTSWDRVVADHEDPTKDGVPIVFTERLPGTLTLYPNPDTVQEVRVRLSIMPVLGKDVMDTALMAQHGQTLANGAIGYLMMMPGKLWSDPQGGAIYNQMFIRGVDRARTRARDGSTTRVRVAQYGGI
jgi:hypothetical protein